MLTQRIERREKILVRRGKFTKHPNKHRKCNEKNDYSAKKTDKQQPLFALITISKQLELLESNYSQISYDKTHSNIREFMFTLKSAVPCFYSDTNKCNSAFTAFHSFMPRLKAELPPPKTCLKALVPALPLLTRQSHSVYLGSFSCLPLSYQHKRLFPEMITFEIEFESYTYQLEANLQEWTARHFE